VIYERVRQRHPRGRARLRQGSGFHSLRVNLGESHVAWASYEALCGPEAGQNVGWGARIHSPGRATRRKPSGARSYPKGDALARGCHAFQMDASISVRGAGLAALRGGCALTRGSRHRERRARAR
jgi:hypothetical protein